MEVNTIINRLFTNNNHSRSRNLRLRTFAVICLNEECGILEWVENTSCLRQIIDVSRKYWPDGQYIQPSLTDINKILQEIQKNYENDINKLSMKYCQLISEKYKPSLSRWFLEKFHDPTKWYETRVMFSRSSAIWSIVGYIMGLGDRHTENILVDITNGECVHVDFDCLFDKGITLARPEIVPFRLTPNIVDAMGPGCIGIEGIYRNTMEISMTILYNNRDALISILEPFLFDPTVAWGRSGRTAQNQGIQGSSLRIDSIRERDKENTDAKEALLKISDRLNGVYNIVHPWRERVLQYCIQQGLSIPSRGLGAAKGEENLHLSINGLVQRLIEEATSTENLAQMYIGML